MISVVTITYNNFDELIRTVNSVQNLPIEHIIINGGSCEKTKQFLAAFSGRSVSEPDHGISDAFNKGIRLATGDGIVFLNSGDTLLDRDYFTWANEELRNCDFVYSDIIFDDQIAGSLTIKPSKKNLGRGMPFPHQSMIVKKEIFEELGFFKLDYKRAMDFEFTCRLLNAKKIGSYLPKATMLMDGNGISSTQELYTLAESKKALIQTSNYDFNNRYLFFIRTSGFYFRKIMLALKLQTPLKHLKIIKRKVL